jgi:hypothetical protein
MQGLRSVGQPTAVRRSAPEKIDLGVDYVTNRCPVTDGPTTVRSNLDLRGIEAIMSKLKQYGYGSAVVGALLAILFGILAGTSSGANATAYTAAAIVSGIAGVVGLLIGIFAK